MRTLRNIAIVATASVLSIAAFAAEPPVASGTDGRPTTTVSVRDLDLAQPRDVQELYARVQSAAEAVCHSAVAAEWRWGHVPPVGWQSRCVRTAVTAAVRDLGIRNLSVLHYETQGLIAKAR